MMAYYPINLAILAYLCVLFRLITESSSYLSQSRAIAHQSFNHFNSLINPSTNLRSTPPLLASLKSTSTNTSASAGLKAAEEEDTSTLVEEILADQGIDISDLIKSQRAIQNIINRSKNSSEPIEYSKMSAMERQFIDLLDGDKALEKSQANAAKSRAIKEAKKLQKASLSPEKAATSTNINRAAVEPEPKVVKKRSNALTSLSKLKPKPKPQDK
jgi:hypothetical protein